MDALLIFPFNKYLKRNKSKFFQLYRVFSRWAFGCLSWVGNLVLVKGGTCMQGTFAARWGGQPEYTGEGGRVNASGDDGKLNGC